MRFWFYFWHGQYRITFINSFFDLLPVFSCWCCCVSWLESFYVLNSSKLSDLIDNFSDCLVRCKLTDQSKSIHHKTCWADGMLFIHADFAIKNMNRLMSTNFKIASAQTNTNAVPSTFRKKKWVTSTHQTLIYRAGYFKLRVHAHIWNCTHSWRASHQLFVFSMSTHICIESWHRWRWLWNFNLLECKCAYTLEMQAFDATHISRVCVCVCVMSYLCAYCQSETSNSVQRK